MNDEKLRDLERRIRTWTHRPPSISPRVARTRVLARLPERRSRPVFRLAAAALVVAALTAGTLMLPSEKPSKPLAETPSRGLLVYELESGTKVYVDLAARPAKEE